MRLKFVTFLVLIFSIFTSCKIDKSKENDLNVNENKPSSNLKTNSKIKITLDMIVPKDDTFQVYYTEDATANCSEEKSVRVSVKGSLDSQKVVFYFPEEIAPNYFRIDMGENKDQGTIKINNFVYDYFSKKLEAKGNQFFNYFSPTQEMIENFNESTLTPSGKGEKYDPILYGQPPLTPALDKMLKG